MRIVLACSVLVGLGLGAMGCSGSTVAEGDAGADAARADGSALPDGATDRDGGGTTSDGGGTTSDGGGPADDGGGATDDAGGTTDDGGTSTGDAGGTMDDAGATDVDGGGALDAGGATDAGGGTDAGPGTCGPGRGCRGVNLYCATPPGMCGGTGVCTMVPGPLDCDRLLAPVCGCDGMTYTNPCEAGRARVAVDHDGACGSCTTNRECQPAQFCETPTAMCSARGMCTATPRFCPTTCAPECGCDGVSYVNDCERQQAGVGLVSDGACPGTPAPCGGTGCCASDLDCGGRGQECVGEVGFRVCKMIPATGCWDDGDCRAGTTCMNARICGCGRSCLLPDAAGTCG